MYALVGDRIVVHSTTEGRPERHGVILKIRGDGGKPPFIVRWDNGRETWFVPGTGVPAEIRPSRDRR